MGRLRRRGSVEKSAEGPTMKNFDPPHLGHAWYPVMSGHMQRRSFEQISSHDTFFWQVGVMGLKSQSKTISAEGICCCTKSVAIWICSMSWSVLASPL